MVAAPEITAIIFNQASSSACSEGMIRCITREVLEGLIILGCRLPWATEILEDPARPEEMIQRHLISRVRMPTVYEQLQGYSIYRNRSLLQRPAELDFNLISRSSF